MLVLISHCIAAPRQYSVSKLSMTQIFCLQMEPALVPGTLVPVQRTTDSTGYRLRVVVLRQISFFKSLDSESVP